MNLYPPPSRILPREFTRVPEKFRRKRANAWTAANRAGREVDSFLEGPSFDRDGHLWVVDIPFGRIFRIDPDARWTLAGEYDGWPNGLKIHRDGRIFIADYRRGLMVLDRAGGKVEPFIETTHSEGFKGLNDLVFATNGDLYFTDQGQTGLHDPTGRVYRLRASGRLERLIDKVPSPNGIVLNADETQVYLAVTRDNAVWRMPLMADGSVSKVGAWIRLSGGVSGPDGMALDVAGGLAVAHLGIGIWRFDALGRPTHLVECPPDVFATNIAYGGAGNRSLFITDSENGRILVAEMPEAGQPMLSHR